MVGQASGFISGGKMDFELEQSRLKQLSQSETVIHLACTNGWFKGDPTELPKGTVSLILAHEP